MPVEYQYKSYQLDSFSMSWGFTELCTRDTHLGVVSTLIFKIIILDKVPKREI